MVQWLRFRLGGQVDGEYDSGFGCGCGCDDTSTFLLGRNPVEVGVLGKIDHPPSFLGTAACNEEVMQNAENSTAANASYNHALWGEDVSTSIVEKRLLIVYALDRRGGEGDSREVHLRRGLGLLRR